MNNAVIVEAVEAKLKELTGGTRPASETELREAQETIQALKDLNPELPEMEAEEIGLKQYLERLEEELTEDPGQSL